MRLPPALAAPAPTPFVGREDSLAELEAAFDRAAAGSPRPVFLAGEPGIGKTRLARELGVSLHGRGVTVLYGRCWEEMLIPYQPFREALRHYVEAAPDAELSQVTAIAGPDLGRLVPKLRERLPDLPEPSSADPEVERYWLFEATASGLVEAAAANPVLLVLEDLHWADRTTPLLLGYLARTTGDARLMTLVTYRASDLDPIHPLAELISDLRLEGLAETRSLEGLGEEDVDAMVEALAGAGAPAALARTLREETAGNPFFIEETVRHLAESGAIGGESGVWPDEIRLDQIGLPEDVRYVIGRRLGMLSDDASRMLGVASVIGREFDLALLERLADVRGDDLLALLETAVASRALTEVPGRQGRYTFAHPLIRETLYAELMAIRRVRMHQRIGEVLEELHGEDPRQLSRIAHHFGEAAAAGDPHVAIRYARLAGAEALAQLAPDEGARWYGRALELHDHAPDRDESVRCELLIRLGDAQRQSGDAAFRQTLLEAAEIARRLGDRDRLVRAALANTRGFVSATGLVDEERVAMLEAAIAAVGHEDESGRARLLATLAAELTFSGEWQRRLRLSDEALAVARRLGDPRTLSEVLSARFMAIWTPETLPERLANTADELEATHAEQDPVARFRALHWRSVACVEAGDVEEAARLVALENELAQRLPQPTLRWMAAYDRATQAALRGRLEDAEAHAEEAGRIATEGREPEALAFYVGQLVAIRFDQGRLPELEPIIAEQVVDNPGIPAFRAALALARSEAGLLDEARAVLAIDGADGFASFPYDSNWLIGIALYAEACARVGDADAAGALHRLLEPWRDQLVFNSCVGWGSVARHTGILLVVLGRCDEAVADLERACDVHERIGAPAWLARTRVGLARALLTRGGTGDAERGRDVAAQARTAAAELGCAAIERDAAELLA